MPNLSSILVQRGVASMRAVEDAIARQVFHGGDLPTNLLEVGAVREEALTPILAEQVGLPAAPIGKLPAPQARVLRLVPGELAQRYGIFPLDVHDRSLLVATAEPLSGSVEDDLGFALDLSIEQVVAPLVRIRQAIAEHYGIPAERRVLRIVARLDGQADPSPSAMPPPERDLLAMKMPRPISIPIPSFGTGVPSSEPEPARLYDEKPAAKTPFVAAHDFVNPAIPKSPALPDIAPPVRDTEAPAAVIAAEPQASPEPAAPREPVAAASSRRDPNATRALAGLVKTAIRAERGSAPLDKTRSDQRPVWRPATRRKGPFTTAMAEREMEEAKTSDAAVDIVFAFAQQFFEYSALFVVQGDVAEGRDANGPGAGRAEVAGIGVPLDRRSAFSRVRTRSAPWIGRLASEGLDADLARDLRRGARADVAILPIAVRSRVVAFIYGDDGESDVDLSSIGDVLSMIGLAGAALERIALRKKLGPRAPEFTLKVRVQELAASAAPAVAPEASFAALANAVTPAPKAVAPAPKVAVSEPPPEIEIGHADDIDDEPTAGMDESQAAGIEDEPSSGLDEAPTAVFRPRDLARDQKAIAELDNAPTADGEPSGLDEEPTAVFRPRALIAPRAEQAVAFEDDAARPVEPAPPKSSRRAPSFHAEVPGLTARDAGFGVSPPEDEVLPASQAPRTARYFDDSPHITAVQIESLKQTTPGIGGIQFPDASAPPASEPDSFEDLARAGEETWTGEDLADSPMHDTSGEHLFDAVTVPRMAAVQAERRPTPPPTRRGLAPIFEGRSATRSAPPIGFEPLPHTPPPNATAWQSFPSAPPPESVLPRRMRSERPIPREDDVVPSRPPRSDHVPLPSVMVDVGAEYTSLVQRVIDGGASGQRAYEELLRSGDHAVQAVMARFPGPLRVDRHRARGELPAASQCGPILELVVALRRPALPFVSGRISSPDPEIRFWSAHVLGELRYPEAATALLPRLFDDDPSVRRVARRSAAALVGAGAAGVPISKGLEDIVENREEPVPNRALAIETMGEIRGASMVPPLVAALDDPSEDIVEAARRALLVITRQDFGKDAPRWQQWWAENGSRHRIEWLIDALMHEQPSLRRAAGDELKLVTKEYFGYYDDLPKRERERAQALYRSWWEREGKARFA